MQTSTIDQNPLNQGDIPTEEQPSVNQDDSSIWIFQANPNRYDILNALGDPEIGNQIHWLVNQNRNRIHKNHLALIWMSGKEAGIYAVARIECEPTLLREFDPEKKYWLGEYEKELEIRVRLIILNNLINKPIFKQELLKIPGLSYLSILRQFQGTNFPVRDAEWKIISKLM